MAKELSALVKKKSSLVDVAKLAMIEAEIEVKEQARVERLAARGQKIDAEKDEASVKILNDEPFTDEGNLNLESAFCCKWMRKGNEGMCKQYCRYSNNKHYRLREIFLRRVLESSWLWLRRGTFWELSMAASPLRLNYKVKPLKKNGLHDFTCKEIPCISRRH